MQRAGLEKPNEEFKAKKKKKMSKKKKIILIIIAVLVIIIGVVFSMVWSKIANVNYQGLNKDDLDINSDIYDEVSGSLTKKEFEAVKTIAFFGTDSRDSANMSAGRADTIILASINPKFKSIKLISIPRDTYVNVAGHGKTKINHSYAYGSEQLAIKTINSNFDLAITEYVTIDFSGLINIINQVGGINLTITKDEMDYINERVHESYAISKNQTVKLSKSGNVTLTGEQALTHSRNRTVGNDFSRANRQRQVLESLLNKMTSLGTSKLLALSDTMLKEVKTNINIADYIGLLTNVVSNKSEFTSNISSLQIPAADYSKGQTIDGVYYFVTDLEKAKKDFYSNIYEK